MNESHDQSIQPCAAHLVVHGRVQGVGFRHMTRVTAARLDVRGWVRNRDDGTVEVWAEGEKEQLQRLIKAVRSGPPHADVERVEVEWREPQGKARRFRVRY